MSSRNENATMASTAPAVHLSVTMAYKNPHCLTMNVLESDSLPHVRKYSRRAELQALHAGGKEGGDGGPIDGREASDHQGDGQALRAGHEEAARRDARRALRAQWLQPQLRGAAIASARPRIYTRELLPALRKVWATLDRVCGKRLAAVMAPTIAALERHGELSLTAEQRELLEAASPATLDRLLAPERGRLRLKGRSLTKPGTLLKNQIPVRMFAEWDHSRAGFLEIDLLAHEGGDPRGEFAYSLCVTDVASGWTEARVVRNRARKWTFEALVGIRAELPFALLGIDSDNRGEFINNNLADYCRAEGITFTRSRPLHKNDGCYVEQKNWSVVRRETGYGRYDTDAERVLIAVIYADLRLYVNCFLPSVKLVAKKRVAAKVYKRYDRPTTPYGRLIALGVLDVKTAARLQAEYLSLNPAELRRRLTDNERKLIRLCAQKERIRREEVAATG